MRNELSDSDVLTFALAGVNAAEVAAYSGTSEAVAQARINHVLHEHATAGRAPRISMKGVVA